MKTYPFTKKICYGLSFYLIACSCAINSLAAQAPSSERLTRLPLTAGTTAQSYIAGRGTVYGMVAPTGLIGDPVFGWVILGNYTAATGNVFGQTLEMRHINLNGDTTTVLGVQVPTKCPTGYTTVFDYGIISSNSVTSSGGTEYFSVGTRADLCFGISGNNLAVCGWGLHNYGKNASGSSNQFRGATVSYTVSCEYCRPGKPCPTYVTPVPTNAEAKGRCDINCTTPR